MLTVNLERELSKQPVSKVKASELLYIKEFDRLGEDIANDSILLRIGINKAVQTGKIIVDRSNKALTEASRFNTDKVYHISQIHKLCNKYYLRFLPSALFNGNIDPILPDKISTFETTYNVQCKSIIADRFYIYEKDRENNTFIAAPASSFKLEERPKDPLLFYKINEEYYYLIHKWGNDLSLIRRTYNLLSKKWFLWPIIACLFAYSLTGMKFTNGDIDPSLSSVGGLILFITSVAFALFSFIFGEGGVTLIKKNEIESRHL